MKVSQILHAVTLLLLLLTIFCFQANGLHNYMLDERRDESIPKRKVALSSKLYHVLPLRDKSDLIRLKNKGYIHKDYGISPELLEIFSNAMKERNRRPKQSKHIEILTPVTEMNNKCNSVCYCKCNCPGKPLPFNKLSVKPINIKTTKCRHLPWKIQHEIRKKNWKTLRNLPNRQIHRTVKDSYKKSFGDFGERALQNDQTRFQNKHFSEREKYTRQEKTRGSKNTLRNCELFLEDVNTKLEKLYHRNSVAQWNYEANITSATKTSSVESDTNLATNMKENWMKIQKYDKMHNCSQFGGTVARQFKLLSTLGEAALSEKEFAELQNILRDMESIYSTATIKEFKNRKQNKSRVLHLEPDIMDLMAYSRDAEELEYVWTAWRNATGRKMRHLFPRYVQLMNKAAILNGYKNTGDLWISVYDDKYMERKIEKLWNEIKPLYLHLHAFVRMKLRKHYGVALVPDGLIPAQLLGNIFGQTWMNLYNITVPFPDYILPDITTALQKKKYTPKKMFQTAEAFFKSLTLSPMTPEFWNNSIIESKTGVEMVCHASAWDMYDRKDFRIKMCTHVTYEDFIIIHHEMGHIEYYMQYKDLPIVFREGANPGFHEAIGDVIALSVSNPNHMKSLGLLEETDNYSAEHSNAKDINYLFMMALQKVVFLPYALVVENWRWDVFRNKIGSNSYNKHWWFLRKHYQGIKPVGKRSEDYFDPGTKYHIAAGVPYLRYFVSSIIQFQIHEALCKKGGKLKNNSPLHRCDIYQSTEAGKLLKSVLSLGQTESWPNALFTLTENYEMSSAPLLRFFKPLENWLREYNKKNNVKIGWND